MATHLPQHSAKHGHMAARQPGPAKSAAKVTAALTPVMLHQALAANIPAIFGSLDAVQLQRALSGLVWGQNFMIVLGTMTVSALLLAGWAYRQANR